MDRPVLLVEDDAMIGIDLSDALERAGYRVLGPCATAAEAMSCLERDMPAAAILDPRLLGAECPALVAALRRRGVPFLVHTGLPHDAPEAAAVRGAPWLGKSASAVDVVLIMVSLFEAAAAHASSPSVVSLTARPRPEPGAGNPFVRKLESFVALSPDERALLERISTNPGLVPAHADLVREGDRPEGVFVVMSGFAARHKRRASGARQIMAYLVPGDLCDLDVALLDRMDHTITTLSPCSVVRLGADTARMLLEQHPRIARALRMGTLVDEATLREWLVNVGCRSALERIAHLFCELTVRLGAVDRMHEDGFELPITQMDLGDTTGLSSVHVNRTLQELRRRGLIASRGNRLQLLNLPGLMAIAEFKPNYLHLGDRAAA